MCEWQLFCVQGNNFKEFVISSFGWNTVASSLYGCEYWLLPVAYFAEVDWYIFYGNVQDQWVSIFVLLRRYTDLLINQNVFHTFSLNQTGTYMLNLDVWKVISLSLFCLFKYAHLVYLSCSLQILLISDFKNFYSNQDFWLAQNWMQQCRYI